MNNIWVNWKRSNITRLKCVMNDFQEPYVLLKRSSNTPLFDERFKNYGYNKVQLIEHLKYKGSYYDYGINACRLSILYINEFVCY